MGNSFKNKEDIEKYIYWDLPELEIKDISEKIKNDPELSSLIEEREAEIIEDYLNNKLTEHQKKKFSERLRHDKALEENVAFQESLNRISEEIKKIKDLKEQVKAFGAKMDNEEQNGTYEPITKGYKPEPITKAKRTVPLYYLAIAASIALMLIIFLPASEPRQIKRFIAQSLELQQIEIMNLQEIQIRNELRTTDSAAKTYTSVKQKISTITDDKLKDKYFIKDKVLYVYGEPKDTFKVISSINIEGQSEYYLCKGNSLFRFSKKKENKILELENVSDTEISKYCK